MEHITKQTKWHSVNEGLLMLSTPFISMKFAHLVVLLLYVWLLIAIICDLSVFYISQYSYLLCLLLFYFLVFLVWLMLCMYFYWLFLLLLYNEQITYTCTWSTMFEIDACGEFCLKCTEAFGGLWLSWKIKKRFTDTALQHFLIIIGWSFQSVMLRKIYWFVYTVSFVRLCKENVCRGQCASHHMTCSSICGHSPTSQ